MNTFTAVIEKTGDWYIGYVEELPGANTQGKTKKEVRENLKEAIKMILLANGEIAEKELNSTVPGHTEIDNKLANKICKDLDIPKIK